MTTELQGTWINELGSKFEITDTNNDTITGTYYTSVGNDTQPEDVTGFYMSSDTDTILLGFVVVWKHKDDPDQPSSTTSWSGECVNGTIKTTWILTSSENEENRWKNTLIGKDEFKKKN